MKGEAHTSPVVHSVHLAQATDRRHTPQPDQSTSDVSYRTILTDRSVLVEKRAIDRLPRRPGGFLRRHTSTYHLQSCNIILAYLSLVLPRILPLILFLSPTPTLRPVFVRSLSLSPSLSPLPSRRFALQLPLTADGGIQSSTVLARTSSSEARSGRTPFRQRRRFRHQRRTHVI